MSTPPVFGAENGVDSDPASWRLTSGAAVQRAIAAVAAEMTLAQTAAAHGEKVDLAGLDASVSEICAATLRLPDDEGRGALEPLLDLAVGLEQLSAVLRQMESARRAQEEAAEQASRRNRAAEAYGRAARPATAEPPGSLADVLPADILPDAASTPSAKS